MNIRIFLTSLILCASISIMGYAPGDTYRSPKKIMKSYRGEKGFVSFSVPAFLVRILVAEEDQEVRDILMDIRSIRILACENAEGNSCLVNECIHDFRAFFRDSRYVSLLEVSDQRDRIEIMAVPGEGEFHDLTLIVRDDHNFAVIHLRGSVDMEKLSNLIGKKESWLSNYHTIYYPR
jgi:hypothetical protein